MRLLASDPRHTGPRGATSEGSLDRSAPAWEDLLEGPELLNPQLSATPHHQPSTVAQPTGSPKSGSLDLVRLSAEGPLNP